ncbi:MAG TPA: CsgG/HfaB family protein [Candidatus Solibacter sp.]|nr:CsgG/HfaB family protein [Candidatus Solibacter sp.]
MKKLLFAAIGAICFVAALAEAQPPAPAQQAAPAQPQGRKKRVAIFDFDYATVRTYAIAAFGSDIDVGKGVTDLLVRFLVENGTYSVIERKAMDKILAEQNFSNSDRANPNSAAKLGRILGVDAIIVGSVTQFGNETQNQNVGGAGGALGRYGLGGYSHKKSKAIVTLDGRIVDIDTAEILGVATGHGESSREATSLTGGGGGWGGFGGGHVDFGSSDFRNTIIGEAVNNATKQMSDGIIANYGKLQARVIKVEGIIAAVDGGQIVLNIGSKTGLKVGDQLSVERVTKEIKDPTTGQVIRRLASQIGIVKVTDIDEISAVCVAVSGSGFQAKDVVKTVTQ